MNNADAAPRAGPSHGVDLGVSRGGNSLSRGHYDDRHHDDSTRRGEDIFRDEDEFQGRGDNASHSENASSEWPSSEEDSVSDEGADGDPEDDPENDDVTEDTPEGAPQSSRRQGALEKTKHRGLAKKLALLTDLLTGLDALVFLELATFYYLECSLWRFGMRALLHYLFLTPKAASFPFLIPAAQTHIVSIVVPNALCFSIHLFGALPRASRDVHHGYLHGGVLVDFIGQRPPTSRLPLLLLDCVVLILQWLMLAVHSDRERLRASMRTFVPLGAEAGRQSGFRIAIAGDFMARAGVNPGDVLGQRNSRNTSQGDVLRAQDAAERGEGGHQSNQSHQTQQGQQQQDASSESTTDTVDDETDALLSDVLWSGLGVLGHYDLVHTLHTVRMDYESAAAHSLRTLGYTANLGALAARGRVASIDDGVAHLVDGRRGTPDLGALAGQGRTGSV